MWHRLYVALVSIGLALAPSLSFAQSPQVRATVLRYQVPAAAGGGAYTGPTDINGTAFAFWSTRCGAAAYSGNILDIWDGATGSTTETVLGCDGSGNIVVKSGSALATTCASSCKVKTIYDQSGGNNCSGPCNLTQNTNSQRATYTTSLLNSKGGLNFASASSQCYIAAASVSGTITQPFTFSTVYNSTTAATADIYGDSSGNLELGDNGSTQLQLYAGSSIAVQAASNNATHAGQALGNGASSSIYVDGSAGSTGNAGTAVPSGTLQQGAVGLSACTSHLFNGNWFEFGIWAADKTANNSSMNSNQHTYWGF